jgi:RecB family exonuclease
VAGSRIAPACAAEGGAPPESSAGAERDPHGSGERRLSRPAQQAFAPGAEQARAFLKRAEVRDVLAWMRLLVDPQDSAAVVRALSRPPIELRQVELARVIQVARRRTSFGGTGKLDLVLGLVAATESPQVPPEARERIKRFIELHRSAAAELDSAAPDVFLARLIERVGARGRPLLAPEEAAAQHASLEQLRSLAVEFVDGAPSASAHDLLVQLVALAPAASAGRLAERLGDRVEATTSSGAVLADELAEPREPSDRSAGTEAVEPVSQAPATDDLQATLQTLREEVLDSVVRIGGRLGELRLDTDLDISHGVVRYLELLKLSALLQRPETQGLEDALADVNVRLLASATPMQREIFLTSSLDQTLTASRVASGRREEHSLHPFLPRKGVGLALSASDIYTYRSCPLRYKFARVLRIPTEQTVHQRFGIVVHQVLERYHREGGQTLGELLALLDACWRRAGLAVEGSPGGELLEKARTALTRYHGRLQSQDSEPVWFERQFQFRLGPHHLRGRVDRVDRLASSDQAEYELIDYKTSRPKTPLELHDDVQLSLYALAAREDWQLESSRQAYYYVLDDLKVPVAREQRDAESVRELVLEVGEGILAQEFEPTPSSAACAICDYRIVCPAAEA